MLTRRQEFYGADGISEDLESGIDVLFLRLHQLTYFLFSLCNIRKHTVAKLLSKLHGMVCS